MSKNRGLSHVVERLERRVLLSLSPVGGEFHVNTFTTGSQTLPAIAVDADGDFVVVWESEGEAGVFINDIYALRYDSTGTPRDPAPFRVNTYTTHNQHRPAVAMDADGDFVVAWESFGQDGSFDGIFAQRFSSGGVRQGGEFQVNTHTTGNQWDPAVAADAAGNFVITWLSQGQDGSGYGIYAQRYNALGQPQGTEFRVNSFTSNAQAWPTVAMSALGGFAIAWRSSGQDGSNYGVYAKRYDAAGVEQAPPAGVTPGLGNEFRVNTTTISIQSDPSIGMDAAGNFVVAWHSWEQDQVGGHAVAARRYSAGGSPLSGEFIVNSFITGTQSSATVSVDADGDFSITWQSGLIQEGGSYGIYTRRFSSAGVPQDPVDVHVNTYTPNHQLMAASGVSAEGDLVVVWASDGQDGSGNGIYAQRFEESAPDTAGPMIGGAFVAGQRLRPYHAITPAMQSIVVSFSENLTDAGDASGVNSVTNPANWFLTRDGIDITASISSIDYSFNFSANRFEATLNLPVSYLSGNFLLMARDGLRDIAGNALDGDFDGVPGGNFLMPFSIMNPARGSEFRVNTFTADSQYASSVAIGANGDFVITWHRLGQAGFNVYAQRYDAAGVPQGAEFRVNTWTTEWQTVPSAAMDADGDFVIAWTSGNLVGPGQDGFFYGVYAQRYNAAGVRQGVEFRVNTWTTNSQLDPSVAMDAAGNFVIAWSSRDQDGSGDGVYAQRFNAAGVPQGAEFRVNTFTTSNQGAPSVAMDADGDFVISWHSANQDGSLAGVYAQRYNAAGMPQGAEFRVNTWTTNMQWLPSVAMDADGDFAIAWRSDDQDGSSYGVYAQRYNAAGIPQGGEFRVNTWTTSSQSRPSVAMDADGDFVISWHSGDFSGPGQDGDRYGIYAQRYNATGVPQGGEFRVNTWTTHNQLRPSVAMNVDGDFVIAWHSLGQDSATYGVYAQRYSTPATPAVGSLVDTPDPVVFGNSITLGAGSFSGDNPVIGVSFYRESNRLPGLQVGDGGDLFVGAADAPVGGIWSVNISTTATGNGTYTFWAQATDSVGLTGQPASTTNTVINAPPPAVLASEFLFETAPQRLSVAFSQYVWDHLDPGAVVAQILPGGPSVTPTGVSYDAATNTATFSFTGILPDGNYRATLLAAGITSPGGTPMAANHVFDFWFLNGDANRDRKVDVADLGILASNWQQSGRTFSQADFNYDGVVDVADLGILASAWQKELAQPESPILPRVNAQARKARPIELVGLA